SDLEHLEPFGNENASPIFYLTHLTLIQKPILLKELHVKCLLFAEGIIKPIIFFNRPDIFKLLLNLDHQSFSVAARVTQNHWQGRTTIELIGLDIAIEGAS